MREGRQRTLLPMIPFSKSLLALGSSPENPGSVPIGLRRRYIWALVLALTSCDPLPGSVLRSDRAASLELSPEDTTCSADAECDVYQVYCSCGRWGGYRVAARRDAAARVEAVASQPSCEGQYTSTANDDLTCYYPVSPRWILGRCELVTSTSDGCCEDPSCEFPRTTSCG